MQRYAQSPSVTIIVPVYNAEAYLERCVSSLIAQELDKIEIILVDDGSTDSSGSICDLYAKDDLRVQVIHSENRGPSHARNRGLKCAKGEYICFVDSDDEVKVSMMKEMYKLATKSEYKADVVVCNFMSNSTGTFRCIDCALKEEYRGNEIIKKEILKRYYDKTETGLASVCNKMYRKRYLETYKISFDEELGRAEDYFFNFSVLKNADCVRSTKESYYIYYQDNLASIMHTFKRDWYWHWRKKHVRLVQLNEELNFKIDEKKFWKPFSYQTHLYIMKMMYIEGQKGKAQIRQIMKDEIFCKACKVYSKDYRWWVKGLDKLISIRAFNLAYVMYRSMIVFRKMLGKTI